MHILVLGAGVVGTSTAWFLRDAGHDVTVVDRQAGVARETSLANGGQVSVSHAEPWANPSTPRKLLKWLGRDDAPLLFRPRLDAAQWRWGLTFLRECLPARTAANTRTLVRLGLHSRDTLRQLRCALALSYPRGATGLLHFYCDPDEALAARESARRMSELGCERRTLTADEAVTIEPALASSRHLIAGADFCEQDESGDAHLYAVELADHSSRRGVRFVFSTTVTRLLTAAGRITGAEVVDPDGWPQKIEADAVVVALGVESRRLLQPLGLRLNLYAAKGYSATYDIVDQDRAPSISLTDSEHKLVISRFGNRLRVAGTAEIGDATRALNMIRCEAISHRTHRLFPGVCDIDRPRYWAGLRPMTPSNVPYLGATRVPGLFLNTGHGTLGWTLAAGCGQLIADLVSSRTAAVELPAGLASAL